MLTSHKGGLRTVLALIALAVSAPSYAIDGDSQRGNAKAESCKGCHAIPTYSNVYPNYHVPKVAGQNEEYILSALLAYRSGIRSHEGMHINALSLSDQDIADIAAYFSTADQ